MQLLALGMFVFELASAPMEELERRATWRHAISERVGARPAVQFVGPGEDSVRISGCIAPGVAGSYGAIETLREMADQGEAWPLASGDGKVLGAFVITGLDERKIGFVDNGLARKTDFSIELQRVGDKRPSGAR